MNGREISVEPVLEGIHAAEAAGFDQIKINCVVQRGVNDAAVAELARHFKGSGHIVRFIEYMDVGNLNHWVLSEVVPAREIVARVNEVAPIEPAAPNYRGEVASRYRYVDGSGEIGVISSVSQPFCGDCTRARLSTDGHLLTCLFAAGGTDLKTPLRDWCQRRRATRPDPGRLDGPHRPLLRRTRQPHRRIRPPPQRPQSRDVPDRRLNAKG